MDKRDRPQPSELGTGLMAVIASSSITESGETISGNAPKVLIVKTSSGYAPNSGHAGTGTIVAQVCP